MTITDQEVSALDGLYFDSPDKTTASWVKAQSRRKARQRGLGAEDERALQNAYLGVAMACQAEIDPSPPETFRKRWQGLAKTRVRRLRDVMPEIITRPGFNLSAWDDRQITGAHAAAAVELAGKPVGPDEIKARAKVLYTMNGGEASVFEMANGQMTWLEAHEVEGSAVKTWADVADRLVDVEDTAIRNTSSERAALDLAESNLTDRQKMVAELLKRGDKQAEIARRLGRSKSTICDDVAAIKAWLTGQGTEAP